MFGKKFVHSAVLALLFFVLSSPMTYSVVDRAISTVVGMVSPRHVESLRVIMGGCPTTYGLVVHSVVFGLVSYYFLHSGA
jgi:hypothetical protein